MTTTTNYITSISKQEVIKYTALDYRQLKFFDSLDGLLLIINKKGDIINYNVQYHKSNNIKLYNNIQLNKKLENIFNILQKLNTKIIEEKLQKNQIKKI